MAETTPIRRISTATLIIGLSGAGKTSLLATFARYLWEVYHRVLLLYSWDGGAIPTEIQKEMKRGIIRFWRARTRSAPGLMLETLYLATKGYWPRTINPVTGETDPAIQLVPAVTTKYDAYCAAGHLLQSVADARLLTPIYCGHCQKLPTPAEVRVDEQVARTKGFELVGGVAFDGLTSMTQAVLEHMDQARGAGQIGGEKSAFGGVVQSGDQKFGGNNRADVYFSQSRGQQFVNNSLSIPNLVEGPVFTALSTEGTDRGGLTLIGADLPGQAAFSQVPQWFGNICEADRLLDEHGKKHFTLRLRPFSDKDGRYHVLKTSASPAGVPDQLTDPPEEVKRPFEQFNLGLMFTMLDDDLRAALGDGQPLTEGVGIYGEAPTAVPAEQAAPALPSPSQPAVAPSVTPPAAPPSAIPAAQPRRRGAAPVQPLTPNDTVVTTTVPVSTSAIPPPPGKPPQRAPGA